MSALVQLAYRTRQSNSANVASSFCLIILLSSQGVNSSLQSDPL